jgi:hypothetical protein
MAIVIDSHFCLHVFAHHNFMRIPDLRVMRSMRWLAILFAVIVIVACFFPWVNIESKNVFFGGFRSNSDTFGKPGILHSFLCGIIILFLLINRIWSLRTCFFISAINAAWAFRNFLLIAACSGGECPTRLPALYALLGSSILLVVSILFIRPRETSPQQ